MDLDFVYFLFYIAHHLVVIVLQALRQKFGDPKRYFLFVEKLFNLQSESSKEFFHL